MRLRFPASLLGRLIAGAVLTAFAAFGPTIDGSALAARAKPAASHAASDVSGGPASHASLSGEFHRALDRHGHWTTHRRWGEAWVPEHIPQNWRPYKTGKWLYTDEWGWYWAADEEWGWITYHYGRWVFDREFGWIWVPADEWGPAWVRWRRGGTHIGWCPLPPDDILAETDTDPDVWIFVEAQELVAPEIDVVVLAFAETAVFIRQTVIVNQTIIVRNKNVVVAANPGVPPSFVAAALKHPIQMVTVRPRVIPGTKDVAGAIVARTGARTRTATREVIRPEAKLIQPAASVPRPSRYRPGHAAATGPDVPNVLKHGGQISTAKTQAVQPSTAATGKPQPKATTSTSEKRAATAQTAAPKGKTQRRAERHATPPHKAVTAHHAPKPSVTRQHGAAAAPIQRHAGRPPAMHRASPSVTVQRHAGPPATHRPPPSAGRASSPTVTHHAPAATGHAMTPSPGAHGGAARSAHGSTPGPGRKEH
jgi:hypothetical protein